MAWVRRVRTASGAIAVQIAESVAGRRRIVRHVGSARDEGELGLLIEEANRLLADDQQGVLDLGITPAVPKATMVAPSTQAELFASTAGTPPSRQLVSRPRVLKTSSRLLYDALAGVYSSLGFDVVDDEVFRDLVIARVVEPTSLLDLDRVLAEMGRVSASLSTRKRTLRRARAGTYRDQIATACFHHTLANGDVSLVLYDVTTEGLLTNTPADLMPAGEVIGSYHALWQVEQSFRMSKTDLRARPMFARTRDAIEAHLTIVFTALALSREVQNRTGLSLRRVLRTLKPLRSATVEINGITTTIPPGPSPHEEALLNALEAPTARH